LFLTALDPKLKPCDLKNGKNLQTGTSLLSTIWQPENPTGFPFFFPALMHSSIDLSSRKCICILFGESMIFLSRRRGSLVISVAILKAARKGVHTTQLLSSVQLSYEQLTRYIQFLKTRGFIKRYDTSYQTTDKGLQLIKEFESSSLIRNVVAT
jgi:predicted transcriptional regulator